VKKETTKKKKKKKEKRIEDLERVHRVESARGES
jgi:hypothetical protein